MSKSPKMPRPLFSVEIKIRLCLKCDKSFQSEGLHICPKCTESNYKVSARSSRTLNGSHRRGFDVGHTARSN